MSLEIGLSEKLKIIVFCGEEGRDRCFDFIDRVTGDKTTVSEEVLLNTIRHDAWMKRAASYSFRGENNTNKL